MLERDPDLIDPTLALTLAATNQRKLPISAAAPHTYGNTLPSDAQLAQINCMTLGDTDGPQLAAHMVASAGVLATFNMQRRQAERVRRANDDADGATPSPRPRHEALGALMYVAEVPNGLTDDCFDRLASSRLTDLATLTAACGNGAWSAQLLKETNLPIAAQMAMQARFNAMAATRVVHHCTSTAVA